MEKVVHVTVYLCATVLNHNGFDAFQTGIYRFISNTPTGLAVIEIQFATITLQSLVKLGALGWCEMAHRALTLRSLREVKIVFFLGHRPKDTEWITSIDHCKHIIGRNFLDTHVKVVFEIR